MTFTGNELRYRFHSETRDDDDLRYDGNMRDLSYPRAIGLVAFVLLPLVSSLGCSRSEAGKGYLSVPQANQVRLIPGVSNVISPDRLHWTWSVLGERNWTKAGASNLKLDLNDSYPLNDVERTHGTNTWNCDLVAERRPSDPTLAHWTLTLHGSNGSTAQSAGVVKLGSATLDNAFVPVQTTDRTDALPVNITLARVSDSDLTIELSK